MAHLLPGFPEPVDKEGICTHLTKDNKCAIYDTRPDICDVDKVYYILKDHFKSKQQYIKSTIQTCNSLISEVGLDDKYLIKE